MASYTQLSKYNWQVVVSLGYDINGKKQRIKKQGFKTKGEAQKYANSVLEKSDKGYVFNTNKDMYFKDFISKWYNEYQVLNLNISTQASYLGRIKMYIIPLLGNYKLKDIDVCKIQDFYNFLIKQKNLKASTCKKYMQILTSCFSYAKKLKLIYEMPTDINKVKDEKTKIECWTEEEITFFLSQIKDTYLYLPVFLDLMTGLRIAELCGLRWEDVDFEKKCMHIRNQVIQDKINHLLLLTSILKTSTSNRTITLPDILINYLKSIKSERNANDKDFIVLGCDGTMCNPRNLYMIFKRTVSKYKLSTQQMLAKGYTPEQLKNYMQLNQIPFHGLRHSHATLLISKGENIKVVSERLGHKDITTTLNTYTHVLKDMKMSTAILLDNIFDNNKKTN